MADMHHAQELGANFVEDVIRKLPQIGATKPTIGRMEAKGIGFSLGNDRTHFCLKFIGEPGGNFVVILERLGHVPLHQRVINYFHANRSR